MFFGILNVKSGELAAELVKEMKDNNTEISSMCVSHLEHVSDNGLQLMRENNIVCVLLPTTAYVLQISRPPARKMIDKYDSIVALGTDFNPNAHCLSMAFTMNLACVTMKMTLNEALTASTINSAAALGQSDKYGSLEIGKYGDFIVIDNEKWEHLIYELVDPPINKVYKSGDIIFDSQSNELINKTNKNNEKIKDFGLIKSNL